MVRMISTKRPLPHLLQPTGLGENISSLKLLELASKSVETGEHNHLNQPSKPVFVLNEPVTNKDLLFPKTPIINITSAKDALSDNLFKLCNDPARPAVIIRGICHVLNLDLSLFTTKTLVEKSPRHICEVRKQIAQVPEINRDPSTKIIQWHTESTKHLSTVEKYAKYQTTSYVATKDRKRKYEYDEHVIEMNKMIKFGTNVDLSSDLWDKHISEINKLPYWLRLDDEHNPLSQVGYKIYGMNTVQLYMKVLGSRTPGHQENLNMPAVNINIGPEDTEWFCTPEKYWTDICKLCKKHGIDYLSGSWWPDLAELEQNGIPVMRCTQKPGDLVFLNSGTVHWVQATGWCNNIAWNVGPFNEYQYIQGIERYEFNKMSQFQSLIPMVHLTFQIAKSLNSRPPTKNRIEPSYRKALKNCMQRTLWKVQSDLTRLKSDGFRVIYQPKESDKHQPNYCDGCDFELFCIIFVKATPEKDENGVDKPLDTFCETCSISQHKSTTLQLDWIVLQQYSLEYLGQIYDKL